MAYNQRVLVKKTGFTKCRDWGSLLLTLRQVSCTQAGLGLPGQPLWVDKRLVPLLGTEMIQVLMLTDHSLAASLAATLTTFFPSLWYQRVNRGLTH